MKRNLVLFSCLLVFGLVGAAVPAQAQVQFTLGGTTRNLRVEGTTEAVGQLSLLAANAGTIKATSTITIDFGTDVTNLAGGPPTVTTAGAIDANIVASISGTQVTLTYTADEPYLVSTSTVLSGVRVNANKSPSPTITAVFSTSVPAAFASTNAITFTGGVISFTVGHIVTPSTTVTVTPANALLICNPSPSDFSVEIDEGSGPKVNNNNQVFLNNVQEFGLGGAGAVSPGIAVDTQLTLTFANIPVGVTITFDDFAGSSASIIGGLATTFVSFTSKSGAQSATMIIDITNTSTTGTNEEILAHFLATGSGLVTGVTTPGTVSVSLTSAATATQVPQFASNTQGGGTVITQANCSTNLLFPWMAFISSATYDTGFAISNTSADPYGTKAQPGNCALSFFPTDDTTLNTAPTPKTTVLFTTPNIPAGAAYATNISNIPALNVADFTGYMIAVCTFQYGHGFAFITNAIASPNALAQGYNALVIPDPVAAGVRLTGGGTGEGLAQ